MTERLKLAFEIAENTLETLKEAVAQKPTEKRFIIDSTIKRFEYTFEAFWKLLKRILKEQKSIDATFPREALEQAYRGHLIDDDKIWIDMLNDRNLAVHVYDEQSADEIYAKIKEYLPIMEKTFEKLKRNHQT